MNLNFAPCDLEEEQHVALENFGVLVVYLLLFFHFVYSSSSSVYRGNKERHFPSERGSCFMNHLTVVVHLYAGGRGAPVIRLPECLFLIIPLVGGTLVPPVYDSIVYH